jgi:hypothetical protein
LTGSALAIAPRRPDLAEMTVSMSKRSVPRGATLRVTDVVRNAGRTTAPPSTTGYYLSRDRARGLSDVRLGSRQVGGLQPGGTSRRSATVRVPSSVVLGFYHVLACADDRYRVRESVELNNCRGSATQLDVTTPSGHSPPVFAGLDQATTCIPGPIGKGRSSSYRLSWKSASDNVTPARAIVYDIYQATTPHGENFSAATYTSPAGATSSETPLLPATESHYFVVLARDLEGNRNSNRVERLGENICR